MTSQDFLPCLLHLQIHPRDEFIQELVLSHSWPSQQIAVSTEDSGSDATDEHRQVPQSQFEPQSFYQLAVVNPPSTRNRSGAKKKRAKKQAMTT